MEIKDARLKTSAIEKCHFYRLEFVNIELYQAAIPRQL